MKQLEKILNQSQNDIQKYINTLLVWQKHVNLISNKTIPEIYQRHILDSAQLWNYIPQNTQVLLDVGSGGGFPGIVLAIINKAQKYIIPKIILVESDIKKATFLQEINRQLNLKIQIINNRIEQISNIKTNVITTRAFADLEKILLLCKNIVSRETIFVLPKGEDVNQEIKNNRIQCKIDQFNSLTNNKSFILKISEVQYEN